MIMVWVKSCMLVRIRSRGYVCELTYVMYVTYVTYSKLCEVN